ncbi:MAG TPA: glycosyl hydrolase family 28 protein [Candidatus Sulfotelmatobacter sp.]|jgi:polygalacturonase|nr:glycosyl hydrolase family 28 protein [Candidatus Sulfotelmatobacter sp.]
MKIALSLLFCLNLPLLAGTYNVMDFGAKGDGTTLNTKAIQSAVDAASTNGGGTVLIPAGKFLTDPFTLASGIDFHLEANAVILIDDDMTRYPVAGKRYQDTITVSGAHDVKITGSGTIDGQGQVWWDSFRTNRAMLHRPYLIKFTDCTNVIVAGVTLKNSPMFHLVPQNCTGVRIRGITIQSPEHAPNTDGIDPSGWNFLISDCHIDTGDDNIAIKPIRNNRTPGDKNYVVENCTFVHGHGMSIGGGSAGGVEDLTVRNCAFDQTDRAIRIKTLRGNGGLVRHCVFENLTMTDIKKSPISIVDYYPESNAPKNPADEKAVPVTEYTPQNRDIIIRNVTVTNCPNAGTIIGLPEAPIEGLTFSNVNLSAETGMIIYHAKNVRFENSTINVQKGDPTITFDADVTGLK